MNEDIKLYTAEGYGLHLKSAQELLALVEDLILRLNVLEGR
jgi:hypothetical protein